MALSGENSKLWPVLAPQHGAVAATQTPLNFPCQPLIAIRTLSRARIIPIYKKCVSKWLESRRLLHPFRWATFPACYDKLQSTIGDDAPGLCPLCLRILSQNLMGCSFHYTRGGGVGRAAWPGTRISLQKSPILIWSFGLSLYRKLLLSRVSFTRGGES
jgi:hypothetical protein